MYACMHVCMYVGMYVCMHACVYACMYTCMYACMRAFFRRGRLAVPDSSAVSLRQLESTLLQLDSYQPLERDAVVKWPKAETESAACACVELPVPGGMFGRNVNVHLCCSSKTAAAKSLERDALVKLPNYWPCLTCACVKPCTISEAIV